MTLDIYTYVKLEITKSFDQFVLDKESSASQI